MSIESFVSPLERAWQNGTSNENFTSFIFRQNITKIEKIRNNNGYNTFTAGFVITHLSDVIVYLKVTKFFNFTKVKRYIVHDSGLVHIF